MNAFAGDVNICRIVSMDEVKHPIIPLLIVPFDHYIYSIPYSIDRVKNH